MNKTLNHQAGKSTGATQALSLFDIIALILGMVIGAGIFKVPQLVAGNVDSGLNMLIIWCLGGLISFVGALCYAELCSAYPNIGGDYFFLKKAFGKSLAFLFAWTRVTVIQTGSIVLLAFLFGDYATQLYQLGPASSAWYAAILIISLTTINILGIQLGVVFHKALIILELIGIAIIIVVGLFYLPASDNYIHSPLPVSPENNWGYSLVLVLLTFGGWNEAAYLSADARGPKNRMVTALGLSIILITVIYLLTNWAFLRSLGLEKMANSPAIAGGLLDIAFDTLGLVIIAIIIGIAAITSTNATIFTGARSLYAFGRDFRNFSVPEKWNGYFSGLEKALIVQGILALLLVWFGNYARNGFETMIDYTAPVFWFFLFMTGLSLFVLRIKEPKTKRPFSVPFYPILPFLFCCTSLFLCYSSIDYAKWGSLTGLAIVLLGFLIMLIKPSILNK